MSFEKCYIVFGYSIYQLFVFVFQSTNAKFFCVCFSSVSRFCQPNGDVIISARRSALTASAQWNFFILSHLLKHGTSVLRLSSRNIGIHTYEKRLEVNHLIPFVQGRFVEARIRTPDFQHAKRTFYQLQDRCHSWNIFCM